METKVLCFSLEQGMSFSRNSQDSLEKVINFSDNYYQLYNDMAIPSAGNFFGGSKHRIVNSS